MRVARRGPGFTSSTTPGNHSCQQQLRSRCLIGSAIPPSCLPREEDRHKAGWPTTRRESCRSARSHSLVLPGACPGRRGGRDPSTRTTRVEARTCPSRDGGSIPPASTILAGARRRVMTVVAAGARVPSTPSAGRRLGAERGVPRALRSAGSAPRPPTASAALRPSCGWRSAPCDDRGRWVPGTASPGSRRSCAWHPSFAQSVMSCLAPKVVKRSLCSGSDSGKSSPLSPRSRTARSGHAARIDAS